MKCAWCERDIPMYTTDWGATAQHAHNRPKKKVSEVESVQCPGSRMTKEYHDRHREALKEQAEKKKRLLARQQARRREMAAALKITPGEVQEQAAPMLQDMKSLEVAERFMLEDGDPLPQEESFDLIRKHVQKRLPLSAKVVKEVETRLSVEGHRTNRKLIGVELLRASVAFLPRSRKFLAWSLIGVYGKNDGWSDKQYDLGVKLLGEITREGVALGPTT